MKKFCLFSLLLASATAGPVEVPPQPTAPPSRIQARAGPGDYTIEGFSVSTDADYNDFVTHYVDDGKWAQSDTAQISQVQTITKDDKTTTTTLAAPFAVMTGATGDMNILISPEIQSQLEGAAIGGPRCHLKRAGSCNVMDFIESVMSNDDKGIQSFLEGLKEIQFVAQEVLEGEGAKLFLKALKTTSMYQKGLCNLQGAGAAFILYGVYSLAWENHGIIPLVMAAKDQPENKTPSISYPGDDQDENGCPKDAPSGDDAPSCDSCDGKDNICQTGEYKNCKCLSMADPLGDLFWEDWYNTQQEVLKEAFDEAKNAKPKSMKCTNDNYDGALAVDNSWMVKLANKFCEGDLSKETSKNMTSDDIDYDAYDGYTVEFSYKPGDDDSDCILDCADTLKALTAKCEGSNSHFQQESGTAELDCGPTYSYQIYDPNKSDPSEDGADIITQDELTCGFDNPDKRGVTRDILVEHIDDICSDNVDGWFIQKTLEKYHDTPNGIAEIRLSAQAPGKRLRSYSTRMNEKRDTNTILNAEDCAKNFKALVDNCDTDTTTSKKGGFMTTKDGSNWLITIRAKESRVVECSSSVNDHAPIFKRDDAQKSSVKFCEDFWQALPSRDAGTMKTYDNNAIYFGAYWMSDQNGCKPQSDDFMWMGNCKKDVLNIVDSCDTDTMTEKHGGTEVIDTDGGCWGYSAVREAGHD